MCISSSSISKVQGEFDISEGASAKWIFDVEIENFSADFFVHVQKTKIILGAEGKL